MAKEKRTYKRSYKNLVNIFIILVMGLLNMIIGCYSAWAWFSSTKPVFFAIYGVQIVISALCAAALTFLIMSGFNKYSSKEIIDKAPKKAIFALSSFVFTLLFSTAGWCCMWYAMCCGSFC